MTCNLTAFAFPENLSSGKTTIPSFVCFTLCEAGVAITWLLIRDKQAIIKNAVLFEGIANCFLGIRIFIIVMVKIEQKK
jgi:hypothetical protein